MRAKANLVKRLDPVEKAATAINDAAIAVRKLCNGVDPGHVLMISYLQRLELTLDRLKNDLRRRCDQESGVIARD